MLETRCQMAVTAPSGIARRAYSAMSVPRAALSRINGFIPATWGISPMMEFYSSPGGPWQGSEAETQGADARPEQESLMQIVDSILFWANAMPAHPAIIQPHGVQSFRMLADAIMAAAGHFARSELDPAKPVAVAIEDP